MGSSINWSIMSSLFEHTTAWLLLLWDILSTSVHWRCWDNSLFTSSLTDCSRHWSLSMHVWGTAYVWWASSCCTSAHTRWIGLYFGSIGCLLLILVCSCVGWWSIVIQHVSQDVLGILQSLSHLLIIWIESLTEWHYRALSFLVHVSYEAIVRVQEDLSVILEVHLDDLVAQSEHNRMTCPHPLLYVDRACRRLHIRWTTHTTSAAQVILLCVLVRSALLSSARLQIAFKMLQEGHLFLKFFGEFIELILG